MFLTLALFNLQLLWLVQDFKNHDKIQLEMFLLATRMEVAELGREKSASCLGYSECSLFCRRHSKVRASTRASNTEVPKQVSSAALSILQSQKLANSF